MTRRICLTCLALACIGGHAKSGDPPPAGPPYKKVADLLESHDRALVRDLADYAARHPKADDLDRAYMTLFEKVIERDWFLDNEAIARKYLAEKPDGTVRPLAQIVATMARAQDGKFAEALASYKELMKGLGRDDQEEFAANFADSLATSASAAGEFQVARLVYEGLLDKFGDDVKLRAKIKDDLARIAMVGKPAPTIAVKTLNGEVFRLADWKGKYVLVDFWATWNASFPADLPHLQEAYAKYHAKGLEILSVSMDDAAGPLQDYLKAHKMPWTQVHNATSGGDVVDSFGVNTIPATFLIGPDGTVLRLELRGDALDKALAQLLR